MPAEGSPGAPTGASRNSTLELEPTDFKSIGEVGDKNVVDLEELEPWDRDSDESTGKAADDGKTSEEVKGQEDDDDTGKTGEEKSSDSIPADEVVTTDIEDLNDTKETDEKEDASTDSKETEDADKSTESDDDAVLTEYLHPATKKPMTAVQVQALVDDAINSKTYRREASETNSETKQELSSRETNLDQRERDIQSREKAIVTREGSLKKISDEAREHKTSAHNADVATKIAEARNEFNKANPVLLESQYENDKDYQAAVTEREQKLLEHTMELSALKSSKPDLAGLDTDSASQITDEELLLAVTDWISITSAEWEPLGGETAAREAIANIADQMGVLIYPGQISGFGRLALNLAKTQSELEVAGSSIVDAVSNGERNANEARDRAEDEATSRATETAVSTTATREPETSQEWAQALIENPEKYSMRDFQDAISKAKRDGLEREFYHEAD